MHLTSHSETGKLKSLFIKHAKHAFLSDEHIETHWKHLNYLDKPNLNSALREFESLETILKQNGADLYHLPEDPDVNMDSIYCRDAAIATNLGMIICNMGKEARKHEPMAEKKAFESNDIPILGSIFAPGTLEGGDVAWIDEHTLAVGHTYRSNEDGIRQLKVLLAPMDVNVIVVPLPHYKGPGDVFHLMSIISPVDKDLAVVYSPLMPIAFRNELLRRGYQFIEVADDEFETMGCNVLALAPRVCMMVDGNPKTKLALENAGCTVFEYKGVEISVKGGGGPTCLTRPIQRYV
jgi:N-dimethylarginine dimethylaminohydrolase